MTKKQVLIGSGSVVVFLLILNYIGTYRICSNDMGCAHMLANSIRVFIPLFPLFLFSLITYRMREEAFRNWWKFACIVTPLSMLAIFIAPSYSHDFMFPIEKGSVAAITAFLFVFISTIILIRAYRKRA